MRAAVDFSRYLRFHPWVSVLEDHLPAPEPGLKLCVVIPSLAESRVLPKVLDSLIHSRRLRECEVVVLVNQAEDASDAVGHDNQATFDLRSSYAASPLPVHFVDRFSAGRALPTGQAGVGLARRLGMDLGLSRLLQAGGVDHGALACLDADSPVDPGYLDAILDCFGREDQPPAALCAYSHPWPQEEQLQVPMIAYELWLRYVVAGFKAAGSVFAFPAIGSCTVVAAEAYARVSGLEPRKAAEDFHFLRKLAKLNGLRPLPGIPGAKVHPAARVSERVPFGTGRAMQRSLAEGEGLYFQVEPPEAFLEVGELLNQARLAFARPEIWNSLSARLRGFLDQEGAWQVFDKFRRLYPGEPQFALAVQHWFDSLRIVRYINEAARSQGKVWAFSAWKILLQALGQTDEVAPLPIPAAGCRDIPLFREWLEKIRGLPDKSLAF